MTSSKWFTANYDEFVEVLKIVYEKYDEFIERSEDLMSMNIKNFSIEKVTNDFGNILKTMIKDEPKKVELNLPKLNKLENK
jgi:hypothetical protein